jgi:hypothetical protein
MNKQPERTVEEYETEYYTYVNLGEGYTMTKREFFDGIKGLLQIERQRCEERVEFVKLHVHQEILSCVTGESDDCYYLRVSKDSPVFITPPTPLTSDKDK